MKTIRAAALLCAILLGLTAIAAEIDPKDEKGFTPDRAYHFGDIDSVNLFNGNLVVTLPIGSTYQAGGRLSYGLRLSYNSTVWKRETFSAAPPNPTVRRRPSPETNAGFGWDLTPTELQVPCDKDQVCSAPFSTSETFVSSDGARHVFYPKLHKDDATPTSGVTGYTRDGTYARAKDDATGHVIELPDGTSQRYEVIPNTNRVRITNISDGLGNYANFTNPTSDELHITDSVQNGNTSREQVIRYTTLSSVEEPNLQRVPTEIELTAFGGTLLYTLSYTLTSIPRTTMFPGTYGYVDSAYVTVPLLKTITVKEKDPDPQHPNPILQTWSFSYWGETADGAPPEWSGALRSMTLPTGGTHTYDYEIGTYPPDACDETSSTPRVLRVRTRTITPSTDSQTVNAPMTWTYSAALRDQTQRVTIFCTASNSWIDIPPPEEMTVTVDTPTKSRTVSYFSVWKQRFASVDGNQKIENGLPFTRRLQYGNTGEYLSSQDFDCTAGTGNCVLERSTYVRYERDVSDSLYALNKRVAAQRTIFHDDPTGCDPTTTNLSNSCRYVESAFSSFDGLGHYRTQTTTSNFPASQPHTASTHFNATADTYALDANGSLIGTYHMPADYLPWLPNVYDEQWEEETGKAARRLFTFSSTTGLLSSMRILKNSAASHSSITIDAHDVYRTFCYSSGNLINERHYGGDRATLPSSLPAPCTGTAPVAANGEYEINHTYSFGVRATSQHAGSSVYDLNRTIDFASGLPSTVYDSADIGTTFEYDVLGRLLWMKHRDGASTEITYNGPDATYAVPTVFVNERPHGDDTGTPLTQSKYEYDGTGRLWHEKHLMPSGTWSTRETTYDSSGLKRSVSEMGNPNANLTRFTYDWMGRATKLESPDGKLVTTDYVGTSRTNTNVDVATSKTNGVFGYTTATTTQDVDDRGRVVAVTEPNSTKTTYTYDIGGHLASVCMNDTQASGCGQTRSFIYDNRGFLTRETHPESGITDYLQTDSRGHVWHRQNSPNDVDMFYDSMERLYRVQNHADQHGLKMFEFASANGANDYAKGKIKRAIRYNWFKYGVAPVTTVNFQVIETYAYDGTDGRPSDRTTEEFDCVNTNAALCEPLPTGSPTRTFKQTFQYDERGQVTNVGYPVCDHTGCSTATVGNRLVTNTYDQGRLTAVALPGIANPNTITYLPNGMVGSVTHANNVVEHVDSYFGMMRPKTLSTTNATNAASCVAPSIAVQPSPATIAPGGSANLSSTVSAETSSSHPLTYQWYIGTTGNTSSPIANSNNSTLTVQPPSTTSYWMRASNNCGANGATVSADTVTATVTVCTNPGITTQPQSTSITAGYLPANLTVTVSGSGYTYQWYEGVSGDARAPVAAGTAATLSVAPALTTSYWVAVSNGCATTNSATATVTVYGAPPAPTGLIARWVSPSIVLAWSPNTPPAGFGSYEVQRAVDSPAWSTIATNVATWTWTMNGPQASKAYLFRVRVIDANGAPSPWSIPDVATSITFTDDPISAGGTVIKAVQFAEARQAIDALRRTAGLPAQWSVYPPSGVVLAQHILEMRQALYEARLHLGLPSLEYTNTVAPGVVIHREDLSELRNGVK